MRLGPDTPEAPPRPAALDAVSPTRAYPAPSPTALQRAYVPPADGHALPRPDLPIRSSPAPAKPLRRASQSLTPIFGAGRSPATPADVATPSKLQLVCPTPRLRPLGVGGLHRSPATALQLHPVPPAMCRRVHMFTINVHMHTNVCIVIVIVITTYHAVYWSYRASRTDRWFLPCSIPWVPGLPEVAHSLTEDQHMYR